MRTTVPPVACVGEPRLTAGFDEFGRLDLAAHEEVHGPIGPLDRGATARPRRRHRAARARVAPASRSPASCAPCWSPASGRTSPPWSWSTPPRASRPSWKDKVLLTRAPHLILDGAALAAYALDAEEIVIGVADDGVGQESLTDGAGGAADAGADPDRHRPAPVHLRRGRRAGPRHQRRCRTSRPARKNRSSDTGVGGLPTLLSNAETYAQLAIAARLGPYEYAAVGTDDEPGTVLLTVTGAAAAPGRGGGAAGTPLREILDLCGCRHGPGMLIGGYHGKWITAGGGGDGHEVSRKGLATVGGTLGAGIIIPIGVDTCPLGEVAQVVQLPGRRVGRPVRPVPARPAGPGPRGRPGRRRQRNRWSTVRAGGRRGQGPRRVQPPGRHRPVRPLRARGLRRRPEAAHHRRGLRPAGQGVMAAAGRARRGPAEARRGLVALRRPRALRARSRRTSSGSTATATRRFPPTPVPTWLREGAPQGGEGVPGARAAARQGRVRKGTFLTPRV